MSKCELVKECRSLKLNKRQTLSVIRTFNRAKYYKKILIIAGTGYGKTYVFACTSFLLGKFKVIAGRVLIVVNRIILVKQIIDEYKKILKIDVKHISTKDTTLSDYNIITIQTYGSLREENFVFDNLGLVIFDEAHFNCSPTYLRMIEDVTVGHDCLILGYTATPIRADELSLMKIYDVIADDIQLGRLVDRQLLTKCSLRSKYIADDYYFFQKVYDYFKEFRQSVKEPLKSIFYCGNIKECEKLYNLMKDTERVGIVHSEMEILDIIKAFKNDEIDIIINVKILVEGFDCPNVNCIVLCKNITHEGTLIQIVGRGARLSLNKEVYYCLDLKDNFKRINPESINFLERIDENNLKLSLDIGKVIKSKNVLGFSNILEYGETKHCPYCNSPDEIQYFCMNCFLKFFQIATIGIIPQFDKEGRIIGTHPLGSKHKMYSISQIMNVHKFTINRNPEYIAINSANTKYLSVYVNKHGSGRGRMVYVYYEIIDHYQVIIFSTGGESKLYMLVFDLTDPNFDITTVLNLLGLIDLLKYQLTPDVMASITGSKCTERIRNELSSFNLDDKDTKQVVVNYAPFLFKVVRIMKRLVIKR